MLDTLLRHLSMVRLSVGAAAVVMLVGCTGLIDSKNNGLTPEQAIALDKWENHAFPVLKTECLSCHNESMMGGAPGFLVGNGDSLQIRTTLLGFKDDVVNLDAPASSQLLTKGLHNGPQLQAQEASDLLEWVKAEAAATTSTGGDTGPTLELFSPLPCTGGNAGDATCPVNRLDLTPLGASGGQLTFVWEKLDEGDSYIRQLTAVAAPAPSTDGLFLVHPLFVSWPAGGGDPKPDSLDRFFDVKINLMPGNSTLVDGGTATFIGFVPTDQLSIHFKQVDKFQPDSGATQPVGCKQLASFKTNAQPQFTNNCASCHAGTANPSAHSAMDLDGVNTTDDAMIQIACNEIRLFAGIQDPNNSAIFVEPNPAMGANHPFKFNNVQANFDAFQTAVQVWVQAEKTSP